MTPMIFDEKALSKVLSETIPPGHDNAVMFTVNNDGGRVAVHLVKHQQTFEWGVDGIYEHQWSGDDRVLGQLGFYW